VDPPGPVENARVEITTMADDIRTVVKDFNRDLLREELVASVLPFESLHLAGFEPRGRPRIVFEPTPGPKLISEDKVNNIQDFADPGEIRFVFTTALTVPQAAALDVLLAAHDHTQRTTDQGRRTRDEIELSELEAAFPNWDTFTGPERNDFLEKLSRSYLRYRRNSDF